MEMVKLNLRQQTQNSFKRLLFLKKHIIIITAAAICLLHTAACPATTATVRYNSVYQDIEGFGAAGAWYEGWLLVHPQKETLYDILFRDLGLDIYRVRNCYGFDGGYINNTKQIVQEAMTRNPSLKILNSAWTPPAYLKSNNDYNSYPTPGTLKKDAGDSNNSAPYYYAYKAYANWWQDSLTAYESNSIHSDYISIQNEPDLETTYESCKFLPTETSSYAGYNRAFEAVYQELHSVMGPNMPKMLAPETMGFGGAQAYINSLIDTGYVYGYAHHLYSDGDYDSPDSFITGMQNFGSLYGYKPLFQTEYEKLDAPYDDFTASMNMALHIHNSIVYEGVCSYIHWTLFWAGSSGLVSLPFYGSPSYTINPTYYTFKHYAKFTDPNWCVIDATASPSTNLRMTAFKNPDNNQLTVVILNKSTAEETLTLTLKDFSPDGNVSEVYRSSSTEHWSSLGEFNPTEALTLPAQSITTIHLTGSQLFTTADANVTKCTIKAGKIQGQDSFDASGIFTDDFDPALDIISQFDVNIITADGNLIYSEANDFTVCNSTAGKFQYKHKITKGCAGAITLLKFDFNRQTFALKAKNIDLTGLACPFQLNIRLGDYLLSGEVNEPIVNGRKKLIPTRLMRTYDDKLVVTKAKVKHNSTTPLSDSLSVKGDIAVKDINDANMNDPNLVRVDVNIVWGDHTFTIPAGSFVAAKTGHSYKCGKVLMDTNDCNAGLVTAKIDLDKCTFMVSVKKAGDLDIGLDDSIVPFGINFGDDDFNEAVDVNVVTGLSY
jgi:glucuronoarabinoxylan endo-1,4-beta-xylanase